MISRRSSELAIIDAHGLQPVGFTRFAIIRGIVLTADVSPANISTGNACEGGLMTQRFGPDLLRGSLDLMVLSILSSGTTYGYELQQKLREASRDLVQIQAGTLYPLLHRLETDGLIRSRWDAGSGRKRKWYELTAAGRRRLATQTHEWDVYVNCIQSLLAPSRPRVVEAT